MDGYEVPSPSRWPYPPRDHRALGLSVTDAASALGVTRQALSNLLNERTSLSADMALRIEKAFGPKMDHLMRMQLAFYLAETRRHESEIKVKRFSKPSAAA